MSAFREFIPHPVYLSGFICRCVLFLLMVCLAIRPNRNNQCTQLKYYREMKQILLEMDFEFSSYLPNMARSDNGEL